MHQETLSLGIDCDHADPDSHNDIVDEMTAVGLDRNSPEDLETARQIRAGKLPKRPLAPQYQPKEFSFGN